MTTPQDFAKRATFDQEALLYDQARPHYPAKIFDIITEVAHLPKTAKILEIGPGTGQATEPFAQHGYYITAVELGEHLAEVARHKLSVYPNVEIVVGAFEDVDLPAHAYDLVLSATALHWIKPPFKFTKTHHILRPHGHIAIIHTNHVSDGEGDAYFHASQEIHRRFFGSGHAVASLPQAQDLQPPELDRSLFSLTHFSYVPMVVSYTARAYAALQHTYSPVLSLPQETQEAYLGAVEALINDSFGGVLHKHFAMSVAVAQAI